MKKSGRGCECKENSLMYSRFRVKKTALLKGKGGGCDRTLLVRTYKATLMDVDYQTDRPFSAIKIKFAGEKI